jgi:hypothetical protein
MIKTIDVWFIVCFIAFWFEISVMKTLFLWMYFLKMLNNACCISIAKCGALDWLCHFGCDTFARLWSCKVLSFIVSIYIVMTLYVAPWTPMEILDILWKSNWLGMVAMLCLLAYHEAKVNARISMLLIIKLLLPTC